MTLRSVRLAVITALCLCALWVQAIGVLHGYAHPNHGQADAVAHAASEPSADHPAPGWLQTLFAAHDSGTAGCVLFDQSSHADLLHGLPTLGLNFAVPMQPDAVHAAWHHATQATGFLARAPPAIG